eukprot:8982309-Lingulodinium_polyedra.AAC.1
MAKNAADLLALELAKAQAAAATPPSVVSSPVLSGTVVKLSEVIDQSAQGDAQKLSQAALEEAYQRYE